MVSRCTYALRDACLIQARVVAPREEVASGREERLSLLPRGAGNECLLQVERLLRLQGNTIFAATNQQSNSLPLSESVRCNCSVCSSTLTQLPSCYTLATGGKSLQLVEETGQRECRMVGSSTPPGPGCCVVPCITNCS